MLSKQEEEFVQYWEKKRQNIHEHSFWQAVKGMPKFLKFSLIIPFIYLVYYKLDPGWFQIHKQGNVETGMRNPYFDNPYIIFSILLGSLIIALFVSYFSRQYKNEQNEQYYKELLHKKNNT